jgi:phosphate transport system protein
MNASVRMKGAGMRTAFDKELTNLHGRLVALGRTVQAQLDDALVALADRVADADADAAERIVGRDRQVSQASAEIERGLLCTLARQAPVARDLRLVTGLLHVNQHLERMGGLCANVAKTVPGLANRPPPTEVLVTLNEMGAHVRRVVTASLACLADGDAGAAERLPTIDQAVDRLNDRVFAQITGSTDPTALGWAPQLVLLARFLERLGDQAVDVGEQVCFIVTGEVRELLPPKAARIPRQRPVGSPPQHPPTAPTAPPTARSGSSKSARPNATTPSA